MRSRAHTVTMLAWSDVAAESIVLPGGTLRLTHSVGSGLAAGEGRLFGLGDRGPNLKVDLATGRYGLTGLAPLDGVEGAKIMPSPQLGPEITELALDGAAVTALRTLRLTTPTGRPLPGLPLSGGDAALMEPVFDLEGRELAPDPDGADAEGLALAAGGGFWVAEEYGPSLLRVDADGVCRARFTPRGLDLPGAEIPVYPTLPPIALRRKLNRGFEAVAASPDGARLVLAFQSGLDVGRKAARHTRLWVMDVASGRVIAQHLYAFDPPGSFERDRGDHPRAADLKVCDIAWLGGETLLVLERISRTTRIYRVGLGEPLPPEHLDAATRPWLEEMDAGDLAAAGLPVLGKTLILDTDEARQVPPDQEGLAVIGPRCLLLATDNDFGIDGVATRFCRVDFEAPLVG